MAITGAGLDNPVLQFTDGNGKPYAGGTVTFTQVGVGTLQAVYSDAGLTTPLTNPVSLNAAGRSSTSSTGLDTPVYLQQLPYDFTLADANGVTIYGPITVSGSAITPNGNYAFGGNVTIAGTLGVTGTTTLAGLIGGWTTITVSDTGTENDYAPGLVGHTVVRCNNASLLTITGLAGGTSGQRVRFISVGAGQVDFAHQNTGSTSAADRLINCATSGNTSIAPGSGTAEYEYDATTARWRLIQHEQGTWIMRTFSAGNFTANNSMTWTVTSPETSRDAYCLTGRTLHYQVVIIGSLIGGTPSTALQIAIPGGFTSAGSLQRDASPIINNNVGGTGIWSAGISATLIQVFIDAVGGSAWTASANTGVEFSAEIEVV